MVFTYFYDGGGSWDSQSMSKGFIIFRRRKLQENADLSKIMIAIKEKEEQLRNDDDYDDDSEDDEESDKKEI